MEKIVITGGLGYLGTELCKIYSGEARYKNIVVIDNRFISERVKQLRDWGIDFVHGDILDKNFIKEILKNSNIIYLTNVNGFIKLTNSNNIKIVSNYGKYNSENFDTIFSKNVIIDYLDNKILGEYLDFSIKRSSMIMSREIVYTNSNNILNADVIEIDIDTKDTKIYMFQAKEKVNIRNKQ